MKYEYMTIWFTKKEDIEIELNKLGQEGWELCATYTDLCINYVFKRPIN